LLFKKHYQPFCVRTGGDEAPVFWLLLSIEVCYLRTWKRRESFLFILNRHTRCRWVYKPIVALIKTAQQVVTPQERLLSILQFFPRCFVI